MTATTSTTRKAQIEAAAHGLAEVMAADGDAQYDPMTTARAINGDDEGWTLETPAPLGVVVRHEGVVFSADELAEVVRLATAETR